MSAGQRGEAGGASGHRRGQRLQLAERDQGGTFSRLIPLSPWGRGARGEGVSRCKALPPHPRPLSPKGRGEKIRAEVIQPIFFSFREVHGRWPGTTTCKRWAW